MLKRWGEEIWSIYLRQWKRDNWRKPLFPYLSTWKSQLTEIIPVLNPAKYITCVVTCTHTHPRAQPPFSFFSLCTSGSFPFAIYLIVSYRSSLDRQVFHGSITRYFARLEISYETRRAGYWRNVQVAIGSDRKCFYKRTATGLCNYNGNAAWYICRGSRYRSYLNYEWF